MGLSVQYLCGDTNVGSNQMKPHVSVVNSSNASVALPNLKIRYYFTIDSPGATLFFDCDYAAPGTGGCPNVTSSFGMVAGMSTDHYLELGFSGGTLAPGMATGEIQARVHKDNFTNFDQSNDYSFDPTKLAFADWDKVTLYENGILVWGVEP